MRCPKCQRVLLHHVSSRLYRFPMPALCRTDTANQSHLLQFINILLDTISRKSCLLHQICYSYLWPFPKQFLEKNLGWQTFGSLSKAHCVKSIRTLPSRSTLDWRRAFAFSPAHFGSHPAAPVPRKRTRIPPSDAAGASSAETDLSASAANAADAPRKPLRVITLPFMASPFSALARKCA